MDLTPRQVQVFQLMATGHTDPMIAKILRIRPDSVSNHIAHIKARLGVCNRPHAVYVGMQRGIIK